VRPCSRLCAEKAYQNGIECICNGFAELSYFADRGFYEDWVRTSLPCNAASTADNRVQWNSTSQDEFSRKWNKPVHNFLLRHVYAPLITSVGFSRTQALFATFLLSASAHELVMAVVSRKIRCVCLCVRCCGHGR
jgi:sterol O-acyltransferase